MIARNEGSRVVRAATSFGGLFLAASALVVPASVPLVLTGALVLVGIRATLGRDSSSNAAETSALSSSEEPCDCWKTARTVGQHKTECPESVVMVPIRVTPAPSPSSSSTAEDLAQTPAPSSSLSSTAEELPETPAPSSPSSTAEDLAQTPAPSSSPSSTAEDLEQEPPAPSPLRQVTPKPRAQRKRRTSTARKLPKKTSTTDTAE